MTIEPHHLKQRLEVAREAAQKAGDIILSNKDVIRQISTKSCSSDLVTQVDKLAEQVILQHISQHFPNDIVIGEEDSSESMSYQAMEGQLLPDHENVGVWCVDPLGKIIVLSHYLYPHSNVINHG